MVGPRLATLLLASTLLALPAVAATPDHATATGPATPAPVATAAPGTADNTVTKPASPMAAGPSATHHGPSTAAAAPPTPKFKTSDNEVRIGKVIGASVYDDKGNSIGSIDDVLMSHEDKANTAVISIGGFLGIGNKLVSVPLDKLQIGDSKIVMPGATKSALKSMPDYKYNNKA